MSDTWIHIKGAREHNLTGWDVSLPMNQMTVVTGPSGSGKTSFALHTLYAEGQRRYVETFSPYIRQFLERMGRPQVDSIEPIPPALALEQKNRVRTSRSTVGTMTELTEYWKYIFSYKAIAHHPETHEIIKPQGADEAKIWLMDNLVAQSDILILFPISLHELPSATIRQGLLQSGYLRYFWEGTIYRCDDDETFAWEKEGRELPHSLFIVQDRLKNPTTELEQSRLTEALGEGFIHGHHVVAIAQMSKERSPAWQIIRTFRQDWFPLMEPSPQLFSFNSPLGACPVCRGFGRIISFDLMKEVDGTKSLKEGALTLFRNDSSHISFIHYQDLIRCAKKRKISLTTPFNALSKEEKEWVLEGEGGSAEENWERGTWYGVKGFFSWCEQQAHKMLMRVFLSRHRRYDVCPECHGQRLRPEALCFTVGGRTLPELFSLPLEELLSWVNTYLLTPAQEEKWTGSPLFIANELYTRLHYLVDVGLGYLTLDRPTRTLSGGEVERVNLTLSLGSSLTNTLFILDEPTVGLHPHDTQKLISIMHHLCRQENTLVVVEHEEAVMKSADWIIDIGPGSGNQGGDLLFAGTPDDIIHIPESLTAQFLTKKRTIALPKHRRSPQYFLELTGAHCHNIKQLDARVPLGVLTCLTGVSGSGKSTLAYDIIYLNLLQLLGNPCESAPAPIHSLKGIEHIDSVYLVDQSPIMRTPRSTPALYIDAFSEIRALFAQTSDAISHGITAGYFSFNSGEGRCPRCSGNGFEKIEMQFLSDVYVPCAHCEGKRYTTEALNYTLAGKTLDSVLNMSMTEAINWLKLIPGRKSEKAQKALTLLIEVGLGHLTLGQPLNTLSGGENQRLKLAKLIKESTKEAISQASPYKTRLLILDEPSTGLHFADIDTLLSVFQKLVESGYSLLVIEHNLEIIKSADYILDLGPLGGTQGGHIVSLGTPEDIAHTPNSLTGHYLAPLLALTPLPISHTEETQAPPPPEPITPPAALLSQFPPDTGWISLRGARYHNLKNLDVDIPRGNITVISGLSGSGKSSLAFGILFEEGQRRFLDVMSPYARQFTEQRERPERDALIGLPPTVAIEQNVSRGGVKSTVGTVTEIWDFFRLLYAKMGTIWCPTCQCPTEQLTPEIIAHKSLILAKKQHNSRFSLLAPLVRGRKGNYKDLAQWAIKKGFNALIIDNKKVLLSQFSPLDRYKIHDIDLVLGEWETELLPPPTEWSLLINKGLSWGKGVIKWSASTGNSGIFSTQLTCPQCDTAFDQLEPRLFSYNSPHGWCEYCHGHGIIKKGLIQQQDSSESLLEAEVRYDQALEKEWESPATKNTSSAEITLCPSCQGSRLNKLACSVRLQGFTPEKLSSLPLSQLRQELKKWHFNKRDRLIAQDAFIEITRRLDFLSSVGLNYLQLQRSVRTLSGGELQRIRLSAQLGSNLQGVLYVLDEPTIGLHPRDNKRLLESLHTLKERGNSLLVVEHDIDIMEQADWIIDLGPGAGIHGGRLVAQGTLNELRNNDKSITGNALKNTPKHPIRGKRRALPRPRSKSGWLHLTHATANNLKDISASFALDRLNVVSGVSGAGKTSLVMGSLAPALQAYLEKRALPDPLTLKGAEGIHALYCLDQSPIGRTPRSTPATYVGVFDDIRQLFSSTPEARLQGFSAGRFSFNTAHGRCDACKGNGMIKWEMDFLPTSYKLCDVCQGKRYNNQTLEITYQGKNIADVLQMNMDQAAEFFHAYPKIHAPLALLSETGLGYLTLGQASSTLSGGEAQRLKLVTELIRGQNAYRLATLKGRSIPSALYLIEEPSIGLHAMDVRRLIDVLHRLVDQGNTVVVIEHHQEILAEADYLLDLGPEAGEQGGKILICGSPEYVAAHSQAHTSQWLKKTLTYQNIIT